ncbi:hypothetical protein EDD80_11554 [Anseongella ginsenosidimutans]|uniref:Polymerase/histidinol phosphatase N-terminal domain-containing protein n=1 Tax=Anseongella ginsenosidimutans TaxID=496056 RepID=A0A4R3KLQ5_9SPHI|nr:Sb-PDE family phosphodiesterase [Anseongella ginsenosidimutans]QEC51905.1 phosphotransferase [Anseongella ginsenosidimutans]TCS85071.1 hypothetical protein EDD80_11554 [Anseongella ginsenosidimutans]
MKKLKLLALCIAFSALVKGPLLAQTEKLHIPDIPGYLTLKGDFHMHTVFSDGHVWPTFRVHEALRDGLDVIAITEHIDYEGFPEEIEKNYNKSFELAKEAAGNKELLIIPGVEISPRVPPYHNNALFVTDANALPSDYMKSGKKEFVMKENMTREQLMAPFSEAKKQDAFVFYNHPGWGWWDGKDTTLFTSFHQELLDEGILKGVEVANSGKYNVIAHRLAMKYNLTIMGNSDVHYDVYPRYRDSHRPMTLVFAKEKTAEAVKEALLARRTAVFFDDYLVARQPEAEALFKASVHVRTEQKQRKKERTLIVHLYNESDIPFEIAAKSDYDIEGLPLGRVTLTPRDTTTITLRAVWDYPDETVLGIEVSNILVSPEETFKTSFILRNEEK